MLAQSIAPSYWPGIVCPSGQYDLHPPRPSRMMEMDVFCLCFLDGNFSSITLYIVIVQRIPQRSCSYSSRPISKVPGQLRPACATQTSRSGFICFGLPHQFYRIPIDNLALYPLCSCPDDYPRAQLKDNQCINTYIYRHIGSRSLYFAHPVPTQ